MNSRSLLLEVCIASVDDAIAAEQGGAGRLEMNSALSLGGLTPSLGSLAELKRRVHLPVVAMLRPRPGGFAYSHSDFQVMRRDLDLLIANGADAVVFGILNENGTIDDERCRLLRAQMGAVPAVFHRAFDVVPQPLDALEHLIGLGFCRVLTSGQQPTAAQGAELIAELIGQSRGRIEILAGGGVNRHTVRDIVARTGCNQVHGSLRGTRRDPSTQARPNVHFGAGRTGEDQYDVTDQGEVTAVCALLKEIAEAEGAPG